MHRHVATSASDGEHSSHDAPGGLGKLVRTYDELSDLGRNQSRPVYLTAPFGLAIFGTLLLLPIPGIANNPGDIWLWLILAGAFALVAVTVGIVRYVWWKCHQKVLVYERGFRHYWRGHYRVVLWSDIERVLVKQVNYRRWGAIQFTTHSVRLFLIRGGEVKLDHYIDGIERLIGDIEFGVKSVRGQ